MKRFLILVALLASCARVPALAPAPADTAGAFRPAATVVNRPCVGRHPNATVVSDPIGNCGAPADVAVATTARSTLIDVDVSGAAADTVLFSGWIQRPGPTPTQFSDVPSGNEEVGRITAGTGVGSPDFSGSALAIVVDNMDDSTDLSSMDCESNTTLLTHPGGDDPDLDAGDQTGQHISTDIAHTFGWLWFAIQFHVGSDHFDIRQWIKLGFTGSINGPVVSSPTFADAATFVGTHNFFFADPANNPAHSPTYVTDMAAAWAPTAPVRILRVGFDPASLVHFRVSTGSSVPSNGALDTIAKATAPDGAALAWWRLNWVSGAPVLTDSAPGGAHPLVLESGSLSAGVSFP